MKIAYSPTAQKKIARLSKKDRIKVLKNIKKIASDPYSGKKLKGKLKGLWSARVWPYRIL
jgi:mRNA-degrading endonuclease RelE of RelBE toxin-antitoxin system